MNRSVTERSAAAGREIIVPLDRPIYSRTDARGVIQRANATFCEIAGFDLDELRGAPHRIVRHPDMPRGFYHLFWSLLKAAEPAVGFVKNRRKEGGFYWVLSSIIPCNDGFLSIRIRPSSPLFDKIREEYEALHQREAQEALSPEDSAAALLARLAELGFASYMDFMAQALTEETHARNQALKRHDDSDGENLARLLALLADVQKTQTRLVQQFSALMLLPVNMRLIAARLEPQGGPISQISMNYKTASDEISRRLSSFVSGEANLSARLAAAVRHCLVLSHCARLQAEVVASDGAGEVDPDPQERSAESRILQEAGQSCTRQAQEALSQAGRLAASLTDAANDVRRMILGLDTIRILGRVESRRDAVSEASMSATIDQIDSVQGEIAVSLKELNDLTSAIHAQLSALQRPAVAPAVVPAAATVVAAQSTAQIAAA